MKMTIRLFSWIVALFVTISTHAATITWTNTAGGNWSTAANWSPNQVPGASDTAVLTNGGNYTVTLNVSPTVAGLILGGSSGTQIFLFNGETFTLKGPATINPHGTFTLDSGSLAGTNAVISGLWTWSGGSVAGTVTLATNGILEVVGGGNGNNDIYGVLTNAGTILVTNSSWLRCYGVTGGGQLINLTNALVNIQDNSLIYYGNYSSEEVVNQGTIRKTGGTGVSEIMPALYNSGTLDIQVGTMEVYQGEGGGIFQADTGGTLDFDSTYIMDSSAVVTGAGTNIVNGTSFIMNRSSEISSNFVFSAGTLTGTNALVSGFWTWSGGSVAGTVTLATNGLLEVTGGADGNNDIYGVLTNAGTILVTNSSWLRCYGVTGGGQLINLTNALVNIQDNSLIYYGNYSSEEVVNQGTIRKTGGTGVSEIMPPLYNSGTLDIQVGTMEIYQGEGGGLFEAEAGATLNFDNSYTMDSSAVVTGAGTNILSGTTFTLNGSLNSTNLVLAGPTITGSGSMTIHNGQLTAGSTGGNNTVFGTLLWTGGAIGSGSTLTIAPNGLLEVEGGGNGNNDLHGMLTNSGTILLTNTSSLRCYGDTGAGQLINLTNGLVNFRDDSEIYYTGYSSEEVVNDGTIRKTGGTGISEIVPAFYNSGTIDAQAGTLEVSQGEGGGVFEADTHATLDFYNTYTMDNGATITGVGTNLLNGTAITMNGSSIVTSNFLFTTGSLMGTNDVISGIWTWSGGLIGGGSTLTIASSGLLRVTGDGDGNNDLFGALTNAGTIQITNISYLRCYGSSGGGQLINVASGYVNIQDDSFIYNAGYGSEEVANQGTIRKTGGTNTSEILPPLYNSGTLDIQTGTMDVGQGEGGGLYQADTKATLDFNSTYTMDSSAVMGGAGTNIVNGTSFAMNGNSVISSNFVFSAGYLTGTNAVVSSLWTWSGGTIIGTLTLATNGTMRVTGAGDGNNDLQGTLTNAGTIQITNTSYLRCYGDLGGGELISLTNALVNIQDNSSIYNVGYSSEEVVNNGIFRKSGGTNTSDIQPAFFNSGTIDAQTGILEVTAGEGGGLFQADTKATLSFVGTYIMDSGATNTGVGTNIVDGTSFTMNGSSIVSSNFFFTAGSILGTNGVISGVWTWSGGTVGGALTLATNGLLKVIGAGDGNNDLEGMLTNAGTILITNLSYLRCYGATGSGQLINLTNGLVNIQDNSSIYNVGYSSEEVVNEGILRKSGGTNTSSVEPAFYNPGTLDVQTGTISFSGSVDLTNGTVNFGITSFTNYGNISLPGSPAGLAGSFSANFNNNYVANTGTVFPVMAYSSEAGSFSNFNLPFAVAWQTNYGSTSFTLKVLNVRPKFAAITNQTVNELTLLTVTNGATDQDGSQTLTYSLLSAPSGMAITSNKGVITWTPAQTQSPSTNTISVSVKDNGTPALSATDSLSVIVKEVNVAPTLPTIVTQMVNELTLLTVTNTATNSNIHSTITGYGLISSPTGMAINASGVITWTPSQLQSPSTNTITTVVTNSNPYDTINPSLTSTNSFTVVVNEVNVAPALPVISAKSVNELALLSVTNTASDSNIHSTITGYGLVNPPGGMSINASGIITWTPSQLQSPSTNTITTVVTNSNPYDMINPSLTSTNSFTVTVREVNVAPTLPTVSTQTVNELTLMTVTNTAVNSNIHSTNSGYALINPPAGMSINAGGIITWTPAQTQSPSTNTITTVVTNSNPYDMINPSLTSTNSFTVIVSEVNVAPTLPTISTQALNEMTLLTVTNTATNSNIHSTIAGYMLVNPPGGMSISAGGVITWTPSQLQGPSTNTITTVVTNSNPYDTINPHLTATNSFTVIVYALVLAPIGNYTANAGQTITFTASATDNAPGRTLTFGLPNPQAGMSLNSSSGLFNWRPGVAFANSTNIVQLDVIDNGTPNLSATNSFSVTVNPLAGVLLTPVKYTSGQFQFQVSGTAGPDYIIMTSATLNNWIKVSTNLSPSLPFQFTDTNAPPTNRFYRVQLSP